MPSPPAPRPAGWRRRPHGRRSSASILDTITVPILLRRPVARSATSSSPSYATTEPGDRHLVQQLGHQAADGLHVLVVQVEAEQVTELVDRQPRRDPVAPVGQLGDVGVLLVVLVGDLADDLLQDVLDRHHPAVPPNSSTTTTRCTRFACISFSSSSTGLESGHQDGLAHHRLDPLGGLGVRGVVDALDHVLEIEHADHVVQPVLDHRDAAEPGAQRQRDGLAQGLVLLDVDHVGPRHHHLADDRVAEIEDRVDHLALAGLDHLTAPRPGRPARAARPRSRTVPRSNPLPGVSALPIRISSRGSGPSTVVSIDQRAGDRTGDLVGVLPAEGAGRHAPEHVRDHDHGTGRDQHPLPGGVEDAEHHQGDQHDRRDLAHRTDEQRGVQVARRVLGDPSDAQGTGTALLDQPLGPRPGQRRQGGFGGRHEPGQHRQQERDAQLDPVGLVHRARVPRALRWARSVAQAASRSSFSPNISACSCAVPWS